MFSLCESDFLSSNNSCELLWLRIGVQIEGCTLVFHHSLERTFGLINCHRQHLLIVKIRSDAGRSLLTREIFLCCTIVIIEGKRRLSVRIKFKHTTALVNL